MCRSLIAPCSLTSTWFSHASFCPPQTSRIKSLNDNPVSRLVVLQRYAARHLGGLNGSDLRLHISPQNMQCNLKTNKDNSERHNLFRGWGSLFNFRFTPTTWHCMWVLDVYKETQLLWHLMVKVKSSSKWTWSSSWRLSPRWWLAARRWYSWSYLLQM